MTPAQQKIIELNGQKEKFYEAIKMIDEEMEVLLRAEGFGVMFQDPHTQIVYQVTAPKGNFVTYKHIDIKRTNGMGESSGGSTTLSKKEAKESGFIIEY